MSARSAKRAGGGNCALTGLTGAAGCASRSGCASKDPEKDWSGGQQLMLQRAAHALWCKPIKVRHVASWIAISAGSDRNVYMQQIAPQEVLRVLVAKESLPSDIRWRKKASAGRAQCTLRAKTRLMPLANSCCGPTLHPVTSYHVLPALQIWVLPCAPFAKPVLHEHFFWLTGCLPNQDGSDCSEEYA